MENLFLQEEKKMQNIYLQGWGQQIFLFTGKITESSVTNPDPDIFNF